MSASAALTSLAFAKREGRSLLGPAYDRSELARRLDEINHALEALR